MAKSVILKKDQIYFFLREQIESGQLAVGEKVPCELELAKRLQVGKITLRSALARLDEDGFIKRVHGRGTFIASQTPNPSVAGSIMFVHEPGSGSDSSWHYIMPKVETTAKNHNFDIVEATDQTLCAISDDELKSFVKNNNIVGIIATLNDFNGDEPVIDKLKKMARPVILAHPRLKDVNVTGFAGVAIDERQGWQTAIRHLAQNGHSNIAVIGEPSARGFRKHTKEETLRCLAANWATPNPQLIITANFDKMEIGQAVEHLLNVTPQPTAILCYSDFYAIYVYEKLKQLNLRIPDDVAVMGICGFPDAALLSPALSTIDYNYANIAKLAVEMVMTPDRWYDRQTGKGILRMTSFTLQARASTKKRIGRLIADKKQKHENGKLECCA